MENDFKKEREALDNELRAFRENMEHATGVMVDALKEQKRMFDSLGNIAKSTERAVDSSVAVSRDPNKAYHPHWPYQNKKIKGEEVHYMHG